MCAPARPGRRALRIEFGPARHEVLCIVAIAGIAATVGIGLFALFPLRALQDGMAACGRVDEWRVGSTTFKSARWSARHTAHHPDPFFIPQLSALQTAASRHL